MNVAGAAGRRRGGEAGHPDRPRARSYSDRITGQRGEEAT